MQTAKFWARKDDKHIRCELCPHGCVMAEGSTGLCRVRGVRDGELKALAYGAVSSAGLDAIEKKPLYHFHPGSLIFSVGGWGCNFACAFCQNWSISQEVGDTRLAVAPEALVERAGREDSIGIAYTYNEPWVGYEFVADCAKLARAAGLVNVLVTNGYVRPEPAAELLPWIDALNIDIKSMDDAFYRRECRGRLQPVLDSAVQARRAGCHVEITNLLIPGLNDESANVRRLAEWVREALGEQTPLHLSAYTPRYRATQPATDRETLERAYAVCREVGLPYVYMGNIRSREGQNTLCPGCGSVAITRAGYRTDASGLNGTACGSCGRNLPIVRP
jgi:pyruvate formate lyase activating enzyme